MTTSLPGRIVDALTQQGLLDEIDRQAAESTVAATLQSEPGLSQPATEPEPITRGARIVEVLAYVGAALVIGAAFLLVMQEWENLSDMGQVGLLAGVAVVLAVLGIGAHLLAKEATNPLWRRLVSTLLTFAGVMAAFALGRWLDLKIPNWASWTQEFPWSYYGGPYWPSALGAVVVILTALLVYAKWHSPLGQVAVLTAVWVLLFTLTSPGKGSFDVIAGGGLIVVGAAWVWATEAGRFWEPQLGRVLGTGVTLMGAQVVVFGQYLEQTYRGLGFILTALVVAATLGLYFRFPYTPYVAMSVIGVTVLVPEVLTEYAEGSLGAAGITLITGVTLLLAAAAAHQLRQRIKKPTPTAATPPNQQP